MKKILCLLLILLVATPAAASMKVFTEIRTKLKKGVDKSKFEKLEAEHMNTYVKGQGYVVAVVKNDFSESAFIRLAEKKQKYSSTSDVEIEILPDKKAFKQALQLKEGQRIRFKAKLINITDTSMYFAGDVEIKE